MNIASAFATPAGPLSSLAPLNAPAQLTPLTPGTSTTDISSLDAFLSLLTGFETPNVGSETDSLIVPKPTRQGKDENKKGALAVLFATVPVAQADAQRPLTLAFPAVTPVGASFDGAVALVPLAPIENKAQALPPDTAVLVNGAKLDPTQPTGPLMPAQPSTTKQAPIAFALRLDEACAKQEIATAEPQRLPVDVQAPAHAGDNSAAVPSAHQDTGPNRTASLPAMGLPVPSAPEGRSSVHPTPSPSDPSVTTVASAAKGASAAKVVSTSLPNKAAPVASTSAMVKDEPQDYEIQLANTKDGTRKQAQPEQVASDPGLTKQVEQGSQPSVMNPVDNGRTGQTLPRDPEPRTAPRADTQPTRSEAAQISGPSSALRPLPTREISMRLTSAESSQVDIKLMDRAGSVHVAVRTGDADLTRSLQSGLGELVHRLERKGFETEVWSPADVSGLASAAPRQSNSDGSQSQQNGKDPRDGAQQDNAQHNNGRNRPKWVAELEGKLATSDLK